MKEIRVEEMMISPNFKELNERSGKWIIDEDDITLYDADFDIVLRCKRDKDNIVWDLKNIMKRVYNSNPNEEVILI